MDQLQRIEAVRERLEAGRSLLLKAKEAGPPCTDCIHFVPEVSAATIYTSKPAFCGNPVYLKQSFSPVEGHVTEEPTTPAAKARGDNGLCGLEAILFEPQLSAKVAANKDAVQNIVFWTVGFFAVGGVIATVDLVTKMVEAVQAVQ